jgi:cytochrome P450
VTTAPERDDSPDGGRDLMRQFYELAGDVRDPYPMLAEMRAACPVMRVDLDQPGQQWDEKAPTPPTMYTVFTHEYAQQVLTDTTRFSNAGYSLTLGQSIGTTIVQLDPPEHQRHRAVVAKAFRARALERWNDTVIAATVNELIDGFEGDGHADLISQLTYKFPVQVIARILGLPRTDWPEFMRYSDALFGITGNWEAGLAAGRELRSYFAGIIADRRRQPRDDLVSELIAAEAGGHRLSDSDIQPFLLLLLPAGAETTFRSSGNLLFGLLTHPSQLDAVRADRGLIPQAIEEALRWETPVLSLTRLVTRDTEIGGVPIPEGAHVVISLGGANRDPARYPSPDRFDIFRDPRQHISFGDGPHMCLGMHLARLETRVLLNIVLDRLPQLRLDPSAHDPHIHGMVFRSPVTLPALFTPQRPAKTKAV